MESILNFIDGKRVPAVGGEVLPCFEPATGKQYAELPDSDARDVDAAVAAAQKAQPAWEALGVEGRSQLLLALAEGIRTRMDEFVSAESRDNGKPVHLARNVDIPRAVANFKFFATAILHQQSEAHSTSAHLLNYTERRPIGVVGCISPWNLPLYLFTWKVAPALAAGCTVVAKPSEVTPFTAGLLGEVCEKVGLPAGVLNIVHGLGPKVGEAITTHPGIPAISFTGGTATGAAIARHAAPMFKKLSLELGGKNPVLIFADCDFDEMLETTVRSSFRNQGQICLCGSRILIESSLYERFKTAFVKRVNELVVGDPKDASTDQGALVSEAHLDKVLSHVRIAREEGGTVLCGGERVNLMGALEQGWFMRPTVIEGLGNDCRTVQEEIFGPVVTLQSFDTDEEALVLANGTTYGLASVVWTKDVKRAHRMAHELDSGIVWVNCWMVRDLRTPFGGMKNSGVGREGGWEALRTFTEAKNVCLKF